MDTKDSSLYEKFLYNRITNLIPFKPLLIWENANQQLNNKYKSPDINLTDSTYDLAIKNVMRHTTGLGLAASQYGLLAYPIGAIKELFDLLKDLLFHKPVGVISSGVWKDTITDFQNNHKGIQYMLKNPDATIDDLINFAYKLAKENLSTKENNKGTKKSNKVYNSTKRNKTTVVRFESNGDNIAKEAESLILPEVQLPLTIEDESDENNSSLQGHVEINVNKDKQDYTKAEETGDTTGYASPITEEASVPEEDKGKIIFELKEGEYSGALEER